MKIADAAVLVRDGKVLISDVRGAPSAIHKCPLSCGVGARGGSDDHWMIKRLPIEIEWY
jgi:hypothetical protein